MQFNEMINKGQNIDATIAVCKSNDEGIIKAIIKCIKQTRAKFILFDEEPQDELIRSFNLSHEEFEKIKIVQTRDYEHTISECVRSVNEGTTNLIMKGLVSSSEILKEILKDKYSLKTTQRISHLSFFKIPTYHKMLAISDVAMNIAPDVNQKIEITEKRLKFAVDSDNQKNEEIVLQAQVEENVVNEVAVENADINDADLCKEEKSGDTLSSDTSVCDGDKQV